jgi:hypothetical protein
MLQQKFVKLDANLALVDMLILQLIYALNVPLLVLLVLQLQTVLFVLQVLLIFL